jgi:copper chaperone CopZ
MTNTLRLKTNLNCHSCVAAVKPYLDGEPTISHWEVDVTAPEKTLTVHGAFVSPDKVKQAVAKAGFNVLGELTAPTPTPPVEPVSPVTYYPLVLLVSYLVGTVAVLELAANGFVWDRAMPHFMGGFFLAFSFFKLLDLRGFADSYRMYDIVAKRFPVYGYLYPFIELMLGVAYLTDFQPTTTNLVTLVVMSVSSVGVIQSLLAKRKIRCACLGTVFNLPMSTVTLVEDGLMIVMAAAMLLPGVHTNHPVAHTETISQPSRTGSSASNDRNRLIAGRTGFDPRRGPTIHVALDDS